MGCLPCCIPGRSALDVYSMAGDIRKMRDDVFVQRDLPYARASLALDAEGWPGVLGRWTPALASASPPRGAALPVIVITASGTYGGTAGPRRGREAHHFEANTLGLFDELARRLPLEGVSVLQVTYEWPGGHRFDECAADLARAAKLAAERGLVVLMGHSMGGAAVLAAACAEGIPAERILGLCTLCGQTRHLPSTHDLSGLRSAGALVVHGLADRKLPACCADEIWERLSDGNNREPTSDNGKLEVRRRVLLEDTGHHLVECGTVIEDLLHDWVLALCAQSCSESGS
mmetsp:Transcript_80355/g.225872  ORF Transcript_80355/g.225872 Transcript_80355/m.225872 type:complete len:288 (-) Transcript_80355:60-923(-)